jgi:hypothetical protein
MVPKFRNIVGIYLSEIEKGATVAAPPMIASNHRAIIPPA